MNSRIATKKFLNGFEYPQLRRIALKLKVPIYASKDACIFQLLQEEVPVQSVWNILGEEYRHVTEKLELSEYKVLVSRHQQAYVKVKACSLSEAEETVEEMFYSDPSVFDDWHHENPIQEEINIEDSW